MKTKVYVCSSSGIDYVKNKGTISSIPTIIQFNDEEVYQDFIDITADAFYNRFRYDKNIKASIYNQNFSKFNSYIEQNKNKYDQILFILPNKNVCDLYVCCNLVKSNYNNIPIYIYQSNLSCYPLAYLALEANKMLKKDILIDDVIKYLDEQSKMISLYFCSMDNDIKYIYNKNDYSNKQIVIPKGKLYKLTDDFKECSTKGNNIVSKLNSIIDNYSDDNKNLIPLVLTTDKTSNATIDVLKKMKEKFPSKDVKVWPITPAVGIRFGNYTIGLGFIEELKK